MTAKRPADVIARIRNDSAVQQAVLDKSGNSVAFYPGQVQSVFVAYRYVDHLRERARQNYLTVLDVREIADEPLK